MAEGSEKDRIVYKAIPIDEPNEDSYEYTNNETEEQKAARIARAKAGLAIGAGFILGGLLFGYLRKGEKKSQKK